MTPNKTVSKVVIAGGGTAGWLTAAALSIQLKGLVDVALVESSDIPTVGVGEATIPPMKTFHRLLRIDEREFMRATNATFKLGINFEEWRHEGHQYFHSFGVTGRETIITEFLHFWIRANQLGIAGEYGDYCPEYKTALAGRYSSTKSGALLNHAYHLDAGLYAGFLRNMAENHGVKRIEGNISKVVLSDDDGAIDRLQLDCGSLLDGDLFIDCTGFKALLIEKALLTGYEDWSHWLPCDSAIAVQTQSDGEIAPYTRSIAHEAGWRWKIPLRNRVGNGIVYSSKFMSDADARDKLLSQINGKTISNTNEIKFRTGRRRSAWVKNCVAIGLSSGFLEPLESTSIHMIMTAITRLLQLFPSNGIAKSVINEYNSQAQREYELIRDFIILHYKVNERGEEFWKHCRMMDIPDELAHRIDLFRASGKSYQIEGELFRLDSWVQVMLGQGLFPESYHPIVNSMQPEELKRFLMGVSHGVDETIGSMKLHKEFLAEYCGPL